MQRPMRTKGKTPTVSAPFINLNRSKFHGFSWGEKDKNTKKKGLVNSFLEKYFADLFLEGIRKTRFALGKDTNGR